MAEPHVRYLFSSYSYAYRRELKYSFTDIKKFGSLRTGSLVHAHDPHRETPDAGPAGSGAVRVNVT